jgi:hypothetical protein
VREAGARGECGHAVDGGGGPGRSVDDVRGQQRQPLSHPGHRAHVPLGDGGVGPQPADQLDGVVAAHRRSGGDEARRGAPGERPVDGQADVDTRLGSRRR